MSEELINKVQDMFKNIYDSTDLKYLRPIKRKMFSCGLECLDDKNSVKQAENCIDNCGRVMHTAMNIVQKEVNSFQGRIDRCLMDCQDSVRHIKDESVAREKFDKCSDACILKFISVVPEVVKSLTENLDDLKKKEGIK